MLVLFFLSGSNVFLVSELEAVAVTEVGCFFLLLFYILQCQCIANVVTKGPTQKR